MTDLKVHALKSLREPMSGHGKVDPIVGSGLQGPQLIVDGHSECVRQRFPNIVRGPGISELVQGRIK